MILTINSCRSGNFYIRCPSFQNILPQEYMPSSDVFPTCMEKYHDNRTSWNMTEQHHILIDEKQVKPNFNLDRKQNNRDSCILHHDIVILDLEGHKKFPSSPIIGSQTVRLTPDFRWQEYVTRRRWTHACIQVSSCEYLKI